MQQHIESSFVSDGVVWEYQAWFEQDSQGHNICAIRRRLKPEGDSATPSEWTQITPISLPRPHGYTLQQLAYAHFGLAQGLPVQADDFSAAS